MQSRRLFLKHSALAMFGAGFAPVWLARAADGSTSRKKVLIAILQRGAMDGLHAVIPYGDPAYRGLRPTLALGEKDILPLDATFGLHPALEPLKPIFDAKQMAVIEAVGSPDPTRSHFDAQDYMESGTPGRKSTPDGWLNRAVAIAPGAASPVRAVGIGTNLARAIKGTYPAVAVSAVSEFRLRDAGSAGSFESMYDETLDQVLSTPGRETFQAVRTLQTLGKGPYTPENGAVYPNGRFGQSLQQLARIVKADVGLEVGFADMGGWDTHVNQAAQDPKQGQLPNLLRQFAAGLAAFHQDLGARMTDVVVVTMSEFGRTARENGNRGTDHGHANVMFALGGAINGGRVLGRWPGLAPEQLYEGRDLAVTTDFRDVLGEVIRGHLRVPQLQSVFPGYQASPFPGMLRA